MDTPTEAFEFTNEIPVRSKLKIEQLLTCFQGSSYYTPTTCMRFRPTKANKNAEALLTVNSDGTIIQWNVTKGKQLAKVIEKNHQILCCDYNSEGSHFATAGRDFKVRLYDEETKEVVSVCEGDVYNNPGHSNRIFCVKFIPEYPHLIMSGGWDDSVFFWDTRDQKSCGSILGASISGDSIDFNRGQVLTGSYRAAQQIQLWDFGTKKLVQEIPYNQDHSGSNAMIYGAQFNKLGGNAILVGSTGNNEVRIYENDGQYRPQGIVSNLVKGCYSVDYGNKSKIFAFGGGDGVIYVIQQF